MRTTSSACSTFRVRQPCYAVQVEGERRGVVGNAAVDARVVEGAALEARLAEDRAAKVGAVEAAVPENAARQRREQRREPAIEPESAEVAPIEEAAAQRELVEASAAEIYPGDRCAVQRDDAFVVGLLRFAVRLGHCAPA